MKKYTSIIISIVSLVLSIAAVCVAYWRSPELSFDYQGVLVGTLSLLVTVLIGLSIYTLVDFKKKEGVIDEKVGIMTEAISNLGKSELATSAATRFLNSPSFSSFFELIG